MKHSHKASSLREWAAAIFWCGVCITVISFLEGADAALDLWRK